LFWLLISRCRFTGFSRGLPGCLYEKVADYSRSHGWNRSTLAANDSYPFRSLWSLCQCLCQSFDD
jgi:hypothetical protein